jgi:hypothetical protein
MMGHPFPFHILIVAMEFCPILASKSASNIESMEDFPASHV